MVSDSDWMALAIAEAKLAGQKNEVPIGAVLVKDNTLIASAHNQPIQLNDPTAHAEILCLRKAAQALGNYRLESTRLYVTLEPCWMCLAACVHARIDHVIFGACDEKKGVLTCRKYNPEWFNHRLEWTAGVSQKSCQELLHDFFRTRR